MVDTNNNIKDSGNSDLLNFFNTRLSSRENGMLSMATIASSASLIFLGIVLEGCCPKKIGLEYFFLGIFIPIIALTYHEVTTRTIQANDHKQINCLLKQILGNDRWCKIKKYVKYKHRRKLRGVLIRIILLSPIMGWLFAFANSIGLSDSERLLFDLLSFFIVFSTALILSCTDKMSDNCCDD